MILYIPRSEQGEIAELLKQEGVTFEMGEKFAVREVGTGSYGVITVKANVLEVEVPTRYRSSDGDIRAFRLPSGRLILTDLEGNLEQVVTLPPTA
jgi:hypothetical protein